jgi:ubiquinone/menaquinone biosynthesis C-methylase UbiE
MLDEARRRESEFPNVSFVEADITKLPEGLGSFDLTACVRTFHHVARPELVVAELTRTTLPGGHILVVDQLASVDPLAALELNRFERARDASTTRVLAEGDLRGLFDSNSLVLRHEEIVREPRNLDAYLDLAGCEGDERARAKLLAPASYEASLGWFVLTRP